MPEQSEAYEVLELTVTPIHPDTIDTVKAELLPCIEEALKGQGLDELLAEGQIQVEIEKTFPTDQVALVGVTLLSAMALETYKAIILPELKRRFKVWQKRRRKRKAKK